MFCFGCSPCCMPSFMNRCGCCDGVMAQNVSDCDSHNDCNDCCNNCSNNCCCNRNCCCN